MANFLSCANQLCAGGTSAASWFQRSVPLQSQIGSFHPPDNKFWLFGWYLNLAKIIMKWTNLCKQIHDHDEEFIALWSTLKKTKLAPVRGYYLKRKEYARDNSKTLCSVFVVDFHLMKMKHSMFKLYWKSRQLKWGNKDPPLMSGRKNDHSVISYHFYHKYAEESCNVDVDEGNCW